MWFDAQAALATLEGGDTPLSAPAPSTKPRTPSVAVVAGVAACPAVKLEKPSNAHHSEAAFPYGKSVGGGPLTWTGRVVSLDAWRNLSDWERHGSTGKMWNGLTRKWEPIVKAEQ